MARKSREKNPFRGRWHIVSMSAWDDLDEEDEAFIEFSNGQSGEFHFCYVHGHMDCRLTTRDSEPAVEWSWDGNDEMDPAQGRGWAILKDDELHGMIFIHLGDDSEFVARKWVVIPSSSICHNPMELTPRLKPPNTAQEFGTLAVRPNPSASF